MSNAMKAHPHFLVLSMTVTFYAVLVLHWAERFDLPHEQRQIAGFVLLILSVFHIANSFRDFQEVLKPNQEEVPS